MEQRRVQVRLEMATHGLSPEALWELVGETVDPADTVTGAMPPFFLDSEVAGPVRGGLRRDLETTPTGVRVAFTRWSECASYDVTKAERRHAQEMAELMREFRRAVGHARSVARPSTR